MRASQLCEIQQNNTANKSIQKICCIKTQQIFTYKIRITREQITSIVYKNTFVDDAVLDEGDTA